MASRGRSSLEMGYHSNETMTDFAELQIRSYVSEPKRGRRTWENKPAERDAVYANRRRVRGKRGKEWLRDRGELIERSFTHVLETGGMRRTHLRRHVNILKRMLVHVGGFNLSLVMRQLIGIGKPRRLQGLFASMLNWIIWLWNDLARLGADGSIRARGIALRPPLHVVA
jgi:transposase